MARLWYISADLGVPLFGTKGCSIHAQEILRSLLRRGTAIDVFSTSIAGERPPGFEQLRLHSLARPVETDPGAREQAALRSNGVLRGELEAAGTCDVVYERYSLWSFAGMEYARRCGIPALLEVNSPLIEEQAQYRVLVNREAAQESAERAFAAATAILAVSEEVAAWLGKVPGTDGKIHVVPNGVSADRFPECVVPALPAEPGVLTVGFLGTLKSWHGLSVLAEAFSYLHQEEPDTRLLIVGDGPERASFQADIARLGLQEAILLTGAVNPAAVPGLLASMDIAVAPYPALDHFYFSPLKVYEYMAARLPVVASAIGQLNTLIQHGHTGLLVPPGDPRALASALRDLKRDPEQRARLGSSARSIVLRQHTWDAVIQRIFQLAGLTSTVRPGTFLAN